VSESKVKLETLKNRLNHDLAVLEQLSARNPEKLFRVHAALMLAVSFSAGVLLERLEKSEHKHWGKMKTLSRFLLFGSPG
jgi:hypothetical protein